MKCQELHVYRDDKLKREETEEAARLRNEYVHKANPTWHYKLTNVISPPQKPLIDVGSPTFMLCQSINSKLICLLVYMCLKTKLIVHLEHT
jgi:hypothetical protein